MKPVRQFIGIANDKGGVGKSLTAANLVQELAPDGIPTTVVEIEQRAKFTQSLYRHPDGTNVQTIALLELNEAANQTQPSLAPLDGLWDLIPGESSEEGSRIVVDFGASAFQSWWIWAIQHRGVVPFRKAGYRFAFFIPVQASDVECADFFNMSGPELLRLGDVVLVKNYREGTDFSLLAADLTARVPQISLLHRGRAVTNELQQADRRLTFRQLAEFTGSASRRARFDAEDCANHFSEEFRKLRERINL